MKPQIIIPVGLLMLTFSLCSNSVNAAVKEQKKVKTEEKKFNSKDIKGMSPFTNTADHSPKDNPPSKPYQKENEKDSVPPKEAAHKKAHSEEDGKHHHFHMHRAKKAKRCSDLICLCAKILLLIMHICLFIYVYQSTLAHVTH